jgi:hypothetical protein
MSKLKIFLGLLGVGAAGAALAWIKKNIAPTDLFILFIIGISLAAIGITLFWAVEADGRLLHK